MGFKAVRERVATLRADPLVEEIESLMGQELIEEQKAMPMAASGRTTDMLMATVD